MSNEKEVRSPSHSSQRYHPRDIAQPDISALPCRVDICLPRDPHHLAPIPFSRLFDVEEWTLNRDAFDVLKYTLHLLLNTASHLSPIERERLGIRMERNPSFHFVHSKSGILLGPSQEFGGFAMQCILSEHNSPKPLLLIPQWPSVTFDQDGCPRFPEGEDLYFMGPSPEPIRQKIHHEGKGGRGDANIPPNIIAIPARGPPKQEDYEITAQGQRDIRQNLLPRNAPSKDFFELPRL